MQTTTAPFRPPPQDGVAPRVQPTATDSNPLTLLYFTQPTNAEGHQLHAGIVSQLQASPKWAGIVSEWTAVQWAQRVSVHIAITKSDADRQLAGEYDGVHLVRSNFPYNPNSPDTCRLILSVVYKGKPSHHTLVRADEGGEFALSVSLMAKIQTGEKSLAGVLQSFRKPREKWPVGLTYLIPPTGGHRLSTSVGRPPEPDPPVHTGVTKAEAEALLSFASDGVHLVRSKSTVCAAENAEGPRKLVLSVVYRGKPTHHPMVQPSPGADFTVNKLPTGHATLAGVLRYYREVRHKWPVPLTVLIPPRSIGTAGGEVDGGSGGATLAGAPPPGARVPATILASVPTAGHALPVGDTQPQDEPGSPPTNAPLISDLCAANLDQSPAVDESDGQPSIPSHVGTENTPVQITITGTPGEVLASTDNAPPGRPATEGGIADVTSDTETPTGSAPSDTNATVPSAAEERRKRREVMAAKLERCQSETSEPANPATVVGPPLTSRTGAECAVEGVEVIATLPSDRVLTAGDSTTLDRSAHVTANGEATVLPAPRSPVTFEPAISDGMAGTEAQFHLTSTLDPDDLSGSSGASTHAVPQSQPMANAVALSDAGHAVDRAVGDSGVPACSSCDDAHNPRNAETVDAPDDIGACGVTVPAGISASNLTPDTDTASDLTARKPSLSVTSAKKFTEKRELPKPRVMLPNPTPQPPP